SANLAVTQFVIGGTTYTAGQTATLAGVGTLVINANGGYTFTPAPNYSGPVPVATYTVSDGALSSTATLTVAITPVNDAPVGVNDTATTLEDTPATGNVLANDTDVDNANLTVTQFVVGGTTYTAGQTATLAGVGTLVINADGSYTFTPAANYNGPVPVATYTVSDGALTSTATLSVTLTPVNDAPVAVNDSVTTPEDTAVSIPVATLTGNDTDVDGNPLTITSVQAPVGGTVALVGGNVVFTPAPNFNGPASFTYTISDGQGGTSTATVTVNVTPVNDPPVAVNDTVTTPEDTALSIPVGTLTGNDTDIDGNPLTITSVQSPVGGTVALVGGNVVFTPAPDFNGPASFTYTVSDGQGGTSTATVTVNVTPVNDAPVAVNDAGTTLQNSSATGNVLANDSDVDSANLTVTQFVVNGTTYTAGQTATLAGVGTLVINANGTY
ncbi:MAG: tandem-95 repeat protein, partial [Comamonadaceae bacterium]